MVVVAVVLFAAAWVAAFQMLGMKVNRLRASRGVDVHDGVTQFLSGWSMGPVAILAARSPRTNTPFRAALMAGGVSGTVGAAMLFWMLWT